MCIRDRLKDLASKKVTPGAKREAVAHAREHHGVSERRACSLVGVSRRVIRYEPTRPDDGALRQRLPELAAERRRFGYRRLDYLLAREGMAPNHKKLLRIYREEGLRVRRRGGRNRALGTRAPMVLPDGPNQRGRSISGTSENNIEPYRCSFRARAGSVSCQQPAATSAAVFKL